jgi:hypothetical protein
MYTADQPALLQCFNNYMVGYRQGKRSGAERDSYPVGDRIGKGFKGEGDAVLLVDVGGGVRHDLKEFKTKETSGLGGEADHAGAGGGVGEVRFGTSARGSRSRFTNFLGSSQSKVGLSLLVSPQDRVSLSLIFAERCTGLSPPLRLARLGRQHLLQGPSACNRSSRP